MIVFVADDPARAHLARALDAHARWCRTNRVPVPPDLARLRDHLAASTGQERTNGDGLADLGDAAPMALLVDPEDAARSLAVSERQLRRLVADGEVKAVRIGRSVRFAPDDLAAFVDQLRSDSEDR